MNKSYNKEEVTCPSEKSTKRLRLRASNVLNRRLEKETEEIKSENKKLRYIIEDKNQQQIKMLKQEIVRQRLIQKNSVNNNEKLAVILIAVFIVMKLMELFFFRK